MEFVRYKNEHLRARFPADYQYSRSHYWMAPDADKTGIWRVGFTKFATRMLGELVEAEFPVAHGAEVTPGQEIGWVEGFKAASDVFCVMRGNFLGGNPVLDTDACIVRSEPYTTGWLYAVEGEPENGSLDVHGYLKLLDETINRMQAERHDTENAS